MYIELKSTIMSQGNGQQASSALQTRIIRSITIIITSSSSTADSQRMTHMEASALHAVTTCHKQKRKIDHKSTTETIDNRQNITKLQYCTTSNRAPGGAKRGGDAPPAAGPLVGIDKKFQKLQLFLLFPLHRESGGFREKVSVCLSVCARSAEPKSG